MLFLLHRVSIIQSQILTLTHILGIYRNVLFSSFCPQFLIGSDAHLSFDKFILMQWISALMQRQNFVSRIHFNRINSNYCALISGILQEQTHFSILDLLSGQLNHSADFGCNAEIFKEPLVSRPELAPHGLLHALLCIHQIHSLLELLTCTHPL